MHVVEVTGLTPRERCYPILRYFGYRYNYLCIIVKLFFTKSDVDFDPWPRVASQCFSQYSISITDPEHFLKPRTAAID